MLVGYDVDDVCLCCCCVVFDLLDWELGCLCVGLFFDFVVVGVLFEV